VVLLVILNPETADLAAFVHAVGLDVFLLLLEIQFLVVLGAAIGRISGSFRFCGIYFTPDQLRAICRRMIRDQHGNPVRYVPGAPALM
jgi:hypothetical protein